MRRKNVEKSIIMKLLTLLVQCTWMGTAFCYVWVHVQATQRDDGASLYRPTPQLRYCRHVFTRLRNTFFSLHYAAPGQCQLQCCWGMEKNGIFYHVFIRFLFKKVHFTLLLSSSTRYVLWMDGKFCCCRRFTFFYVASEGEDDEHWTVLQKFFCNASEIIWKIFFLSTKKFPFSPTLSTPSDWKRLKTEG